jgi:AcrR family transcriptional regulator
MANCSVRHYDYACGVVSTDELASQRLPRGRHGLPREQVVQSQRSRIFRAMAETMAAKGYAATSVAEVLRAAGVSRETFYEQFSSKEDCFMSAWEAAAAAILGAALDAPASDGAALERFDRGLRSYLDALASHPQLARMFLIEIYAAGPAALRRRAALQQRYADMINEIFGHRDAADRFANEALVVAISGMVTARLAEDDLKGLRALHAPLVELARRLQVANPDIANRRVRNS